MAKRSTNLNRYKKASSTEAVADLMRHYGITAADLRAWARKDAGTSRKSVTCPRCDKFIEVEVSNFDGSAVCPACENEITVGVP